MDRERREDGKKERQRKDFLMGDSRQELAKLCLCMCVLYGVIQTPTVVHHGNRGY